MGTIAVGTRLLLLLMISFGLNVPLGTWRVVSKKFSLSWFAAIHLAVPLIYFLRVSSGLSYYAIPILVAAAFLGQLAGGWLKKYLRSKFILLIAGRKTTAANLISRKRKLGRNH